MLEIFIPTKIKNYSEINVLQKNFLDILENKFNDLKIEKFESKFFEWIKIYSKNFNENLIILCNWEFGENYFIDFDYTKNNFEFLGTKIIWENKIWEKIENIEKNISEIIKLLNSNNLLTNTKKQYIKNKINSSFFALSWVVFLLYLLKKQTDKNLQDLQNINSSIEYEAQASLLAETSKTKQIELQAQIDKLEKRVDFFIDTVKKLIK